MQCFYSIGSCEWCSQLCSSLLYLYNAQIKLINVILSEDRLEYTCTGTLCCIDWIERYILILKLGSVACEYQYMLSVVSLSVSNLSVFASHTSCSPDEAVWSPPGLYGRAAIMCGGGGSQCLHYELLHSDNHFRIRQR